MKKKSFWIIFLIFILSTSCLERTKNFPSNNDGDNDGDIETSLRGSNTGHDACNSMAVDSSGNIYCGGRTNGAMGEANGGGGFDAFIMKFNSSGTLQWVKQLGAVTVALGGSNAGTDNCTSIAVDSSGNVYCAGSTTGAMGEANGGGNDAFIMKLNSSGTLQWVKQLGAVTEEVGGSNAGHDYCNSIAVDSSGNIYCAGSTASAMGEANGGGSDAFIMKLNSSGILQWVKQLGAVTVAAGGTNGGSEYCFSIAVDSSSNVYCAGSTTGAMGEASGGSYDAFIMKLNSSGTLQWVKQLGAVTEEVGGSNAGTDYCNSIAVDNTGNPFCGGYTTSAMGEANGGGGDAFIMKLNSSGTLQWVKQLGAVTQEVGGSNAGWDYCNSIAFDNIGNLFCGGYTTSAMGEATGGSNDAFIMKLNSSGTFQWVKQLGAVTEEVGGSNAGHDDCFSIAVDSSGNIYCGGRTTGAMGEASGGSFDAFVMKLNSSGTLQWVKQLGADTFATF